MLLYQPCRSRVLQRLWWRETLLLSGIWLILQEEEAVSK